MEGKELEQLKELEYKEDLKKIENSNFTRSWVSASAYLFYLGIACFVLMTWGGCYRLYNKKFEKPKVEIQSSTLYTPQYK